MIPSQTLEEFEPFAESGDKVAPVPAKYAQGYLPGEVFPAQHENFLMGKASRCSTQHRAGLRSIEAELNNVVDAGGAEPDDTDDTQVLDAINYLIAQAIAAEREKEMPKGFLWWTSTPPTSPGGDPNTLFPGTTWVRIKDTFVYAAGDNDTVTSAQGAGGHTTAEDGSFTSLIGANNLPQHTHALGGDTGSTKPSFTNPTYTTETGGAWSFYIRCTDTSGDRTIYGGTNTTASNDSSSFSSLRSSGSAKRDILSHSGHTHTVTLSTSGSVQSHSHSLPADTGNNTTTATALSVKNPLIKRYCWERVS